MDHLCCSAQHLRVEHAAMLSAFQLVAPKQLEIADVFRFSDPTSTASRSKTKVT